MYSLDAQDCIKVSFKGQRSVKISFAQLRYSKSCSYERLTSVSLSQMKNMQVMCQDDSSGELVKAKIDYSGYINGYS